MTRRSVVWMLVGVCVAGASIWYARELTLSTSVPPLPEKPSANSVAVDFKRDILPILSGKCYSCHGPDQTARKGGLRLDQRDAALKPIGWSAPAIVPGKSADSEVIRRILSDDDDERMPPKKTGKPLTDAEKDLLQRWIDQGAEYQLHWAFVKPERAKLPVVKDKAWVKNEIDAFVLAKLEAAGLAPAPQADRVTLIRRLSLDLRGLPPTLGEIDAFLADDSRDAYEKLVNRMLDSPRYGEKMALLWLDLARFGDTSGYHQDSTRQMYLWRDWVINAFNQNMPFDQFTIMQLAGDLLPNAGDQQKIASGFNRNTRFNEEGGVDPEEYVIRYNIDRTNTLGQVWLGLTLGCAECHTHKYDPISHKEYYQLFAYFTGITEPMVEGESVHGRPLPPLLMVPTPEQAKALTNLRKDLAHVEEVIAKELQRYSAAYKDPYESKTVPEIVLLNLYLKSQLAWEAQAKDSLKPPTPVRDALQIEPAKRDATKNKVVRDYYLRKVHAEFRKELAPFEEDYEDFTRKIRQIENAIPYTLISEEMAIPRHAHVLIRGDFLQKGERVERGVPAVLSPLPKDGPKNRLGLVRWLVSPEHPLTGRVTVNRLWAQMFGTGLVRTLGDFGSQGDYPSHPELLDWLAAEFVLPRPTGNASLGNSAWDVKVLLRTIALSATYQQSSIYLHDSAKIDPLNRLLSHSPRHRLSAEEIRDSALAIAGVLSNKIGGPSFMPYQPSDFYKFKNEAWVWTSSDGDDQYRRGMYVFWRRTALHPMFVTLDAPTREECVVSRPRTNTPLGALVTLNDPTFVEAARVFAQRILTQGPKEHDARLAFAFRTATCRAPSETELKILRHRFEQQRARFAADPDAASRLVNAGQYARDASLEVSELAAWTTLCNLVLNLDEVLTRE